MFGTLIRRKPVRPLGQQDEAFEFDQLLAVDRGAAARGAARRPAHPVDAARRQADRGERARATDPRAQRLGRRADGRDRPSAGRRRPGRARTELAEDPGDAWCGPATARSGSKFDQNVDLGELLAGRKPRHGFRPRPPRLEVECKATLKLGKTYYTVDVHDISLGGLKVEPIEEYCLGKQVVVVVESLRPIRGEVRWFSDRKAGIVFDKPMRVRGTGRMDRQTARTRRAEGELQALGL